MYKVSILCFATLGLCALACSAEDEPNGKVSSGGSAGTAGGTALAQGGATGRGGSGQPTAGAEATSGGSESAMGGAAGTGGNAGTAPASCESAVFAPLSEGCKEQNKDTFVYACEKELVLLAIGAVPKDSQPLATREEAFRYLNEENYLGKYSVAQRVRALSNNQVRVKFVLEWVTLPGTFADYDSNNGEPKRDFTEDTVNAVIAKGFDFTQLSDADAAHPGYKYPFTILNLGEYVYPNVCGWDQWSNGDSGFSSMTYFRSGDDVGVILHEFGHCLFDWGEYYSDASGSGTGDWDAMTWGFGMSYNPFLRSCRQWSSTYDIATYPIGTVFDIPANDNVVLRYRTGARPSEYFLVEAVQKGGVFLEMPGEGLLIWHVDEKMKWQMDANTPSAHYQVALEQADGKFEMEEGSSAGDDGDAFRAGFADTFGATTKPNSNFYDGAPSGFEVSSISKVGKRMSFMLGPVGTKAVGAPVRFENCSSSCR